MVTNAVSRISGQVRSTSAVGSIMPGKMLRTRLAARMHEHLPSQVSVAELVHVCAATEMIHTASLCHDDVIDEATARRAQPTLWCATTPSYAILIGDLLLCEAMSTIAQVRQGQHIVPLLTKVKEVCATEAEQELVLRHRRLDIPTCLRVARGKTGPLFAFVAQACGGTDRELSSALEESGYRIGTAYQLADDLLDMSGLDEILGKTLGTDAQRGKLTLPHSVKHGTDEACTQIRQQLESALECLTPWAAARRALTAYLRSDLQAAVQGRITLWQSDIDLGLAV
ncbi:MAG: hypothetical protein HN742_00825 [Lentisphaerae bacterium]|nr:hypothetical protein [Lentisphaerota bacterium]MBT5606375.1 hypothetical protein [Lentisphaerota bacterium]MBT7056770.1 hypothetical protein [Lentisphaerota bacterium]MBT7840375.1 hypothetical protein [Lentisphaerota bacterium]